MSLEIIVIEVTVGHLTLKALDVVVGAFNLKKRTIVMLELAMEITFIDTAATKTDVT